MSDELAPHSSTDARSRADILNTSKFIYSAPSSTAPSPERSWNELHGILHAETIQALNSIFDDCNGLHKGLAHYYYVVAHGACDFKLFLRPGASKTITYLMIIFNYMVELYEKRRSYDPEANIDACCYAMIVCDSRCCAMEIYQTAKALAKALSNFVFISVKLAANEDVDENLADMLTGRAHILVCEPKGLDLLRSSDADFLSRNVDEPAVTTTNDPEVRRSAFSRRSALSLYKDRTASAFATVEHLVIENRHYTSEAKEGEVSATLVAFLAKCSDDCSLWALAASAVEDESLNRLMTSVKGGDYRHRQFIAVPDTYDFPSPSLNINVEIKLILSQDPSSSKRIDLKFKGPGRTRESVTVEAHELDMLQMLGILRTISVPERMVVITASDRMCALAQRYIASMKLEPHHGMCLIAERRPYKRSYEAFFLEKSRNFLMTTAESVRGITNIQADRIIILEVGDANWDDFDGLLSSVNRGDRDKPCEVVVIAGEADKDKLILRQFATLAESHGNGVASTILSDIQEYYWKENEDEDEDKAAEGSKEGTK